MICDVYVYENESIADNFSGYEVTSISVHLIKNFYNNSYTNFTLHDSKYIYLSLNF